MSSKGSSPSSSPTRLETPSTATEAELVKFDADSSSSKQRSQLPTDGKPDEDIKEGDDSKSPDDEEVDKADSQSSVDPVSATGDAASSDVPAVMPASNALMQGDWQAIWSQQHNAYYFYNIMTKQTTWDNPVANSQTAGPSQASSSLDAQAAAAVAQGIDPELAFLDPSLGSGPSNPASFTFAAKFNSRTGAFTKLDGRDPEHVSEYERMRRMNGVFFDMDAWQQEVDHRYAEEEEAGKKRKKPTKKDLDMYKERKKQKKLAKTAWLRT